MMPSHLFNRYHLPSRHTSEFGDDSTTIPPTKRKRRPNTDHEYRRDINKRIRSRLPGSQPGRGDNAGRFRKIPPAVIVIIARLLGCRDLCALRWACRYLRHSTLHYFESKYSIQTVRTDFSKRSLKRFQDLCRHKELAWKVETLIICNPPGTSFGDGFSWRFNKPRSRNDSQHLLPMQGAVHAWQAVFRHMVNYRNVEIIGTSAEMGDSLRGYGKALSASDAIMLVCYVIARVQIPLQTFCVDFSMVPGDHDLIPCIHPRHVSHAFLRRSPDFLAAWSNTRSLILRGALRGDLFAGLMMHTGRLEKLELTKCWWPDLGNTFHVLKLLGRSLQLREFRLEWSDASQHALATLLKQVKPSLRKLYPGHLKLRWGSWIPILTQLRARNTTILEEISLIELSSVGFVKSQLHFPRLSSNAVVDPETGSEVTYSSRVVGGGFGRCLNTGIRYSGPRMDIALQRLPDWGQEASFS